MKQILNQLRTGKIELADVPAPVVASGFLQIRTRRTLVSQGTEKMLVQFGKASLFQKARSQPEKVRQVMAKIRTDGLMPTMEAVFRKLDEPMLLGYCNVGVVAAVGEQSGGAPEVGSARDWRLGEASRQMRQFKVGDRVASNGSHAEVVSVPTNLCAKIPDNVSDEAAAFTVIGAIGLQAIRLMKPELGETIVVIGLGLIGQITVQLLKAHGCRVIGFDFDLTKVAMARTFGVMAMQAGGELDPVNWVLQQTGGIGVDGVIIAASTSSDDVISQSARMSRKRGRIVLVGVVGLNIRRADFYEKELTFQVSCSYGPGRYDDIYEKQGFDYPHAYVRWTENRNFQAVLEALSSGALIVEPLITRRVPLEQYREIYDDMGTGELASLLIYDELATASSNQVPANAGGGAAGLQSSRLRDCESHGPRALVSANQRPIPDISSSPSLASTLRVTSRDVGSAALAVIGTGNFTKMTVMPALAAIKAPVKFVVSNGGVTGTSLAKKYGVPFSSTDYLAALADPDIRGVIITTRHNLHAEQVVAALSAGKHVLVEKPLCLNMTELNQIETVAAVPRSIEPSGHVGIGVVARGTSGRTGGETDSQEPFEAQRATLTVGYNRRFSPHVEKMKALLGADTVPISLVATMNAGAIPMTHWVHDPQIGGGRLVGEACHFIDLAIHLTNSLIVEVSATQPEAVTDSASILLRHAGGSTSVVNYFSHGHRELSKERIEVHSQGRSLLLDNFCELRGYGFKSFSKLKTRQDKGHARQFSLFVDRVRNGGPALIPWSEIVNSTRATFAVLESIRSRAAIRVDPT